MDGVKAALVVAAYEFEDPKFRALRSPARDVEALASVLGDPAVGGFGVQAVVNQPGPVVQQELERFFSGRRPDDLLLVYFSCHGVKDAAGKLHFATTNTLFELLRSTGISASFVSEQLELTRSKRVVVLLDCCYSGAFLKGFRERGPRLRARPHRRGTGARRGTAGERRPGVPRGASGGGRGGVIRGWGTSTRSSPASGRARCSLPAAGGSAP